MNSKRIFGLVLIILALIFSIVSIRSILSFFTYLNQYSGGDAYGIGRILGSLIGSSILLILTFLLWKFGIRWINNQTKE